MPFGPAVFGLAVLAALSSGAPGRPAGPQAAPPDTVRLEEELLQALNVERASRHLMPVSPVPELLAIARAHSAEMSARDVLSHESAAGKSYQQRLSDAGVISVASGENLSRSTTSVARLIHQSLMDSPAHRDNMLNPAFDAVGIGVARRDGERYFVTMDFIRQFIRKSGDEVRELTLGALTEARTRAGLRPFVATAAANRVADELAEAYAAEGAIPPVPLIGQRSTAYFVAGLDLDGLLAAVRELEVRGYGRGGVGSTFRRSRQYPAGAYAVCIILVWDGS